MYASTKGLFAIRCYILRPKVLHWCLVQSLDTKELKAQSLPIRHKSITDHQKTQNQSFFSPDYKNKVTLDRDSLTLQLGTV